MDGVDGLNDQVRSHILGFLIPFTAVTFLCRDFGNIHSILAMLHGLGGHSIASLIHPGNGVGVDGIYGLDRQIRDDALGLLIPGASVAFLSGDLGNILCVLAILHSLGGYGASVFIHPGNRVGVDGVYGLDGQVGGDILSLGFPYAGVAFLGRNSGNIHCILAVLNGFGCHSISILIHPGNGEGMDLPHRVQGHIGIQRNDRTGCVSHLAVSGSCPALEAVASSDEGILSQSDLIVAGEDLILGHGNRGHFAAAAVGIISQGSVCGLDPLILGAVPHIDIAGNRILSFGVASVSIQQTDTGKGNQRRGNLIAQLDGLIGNAESLFLSVCQIHRIQTGVQLNDAGTVAGMDICTAFGGVQMAVGSNLTIQIDLNVHQVRQGTIVFSGISIGNRDKFQALIDKSAVGFMRQLAGLRLGIIVAPFVSIININVPALCNIQFSTLGHGHSGTGQQGHILIDHSFSGIDPDGDIAVDGQGVVRRVDFHVVQFQGQRIDLGIAIDLDQQTVLLGQVFLGDPAALFRHKHSTVADELDTGRQSHAVYGQRGIDILIRAGFQSHLHFHVLDIILGQGEHADLLAQALGVCQVQGSRTATEVGKLHIFIDSGARLCGNRTVADNIAPDIGSTAIIDDDLRALCHLNEAHRTGGTANIGYLGICAAAGNVLAADTDSAVDGDRGTGSQSQRLIGIRLDPGNTVCVSAGIGRGRGVAGICIIKRNQQCNTGGDGIIAGNAATADQVDPGLSVSDSIGACLIQVQKFRACNFKYRHRVGDELRHDRLIRIGLVDCLRFIGNIVSGGNIVPTKELIALISSCLQGIGQAGILCQLGIVSNLHHITRGIGNGVGAVLCLTEGGNGIPLHNQCQVGNGQNHLILAAVIGYRQKKLESFVLCHFFGETAAAAAGIGSFLRAGRTANGERTLYHFICIVKAQLGAGALIIGKGQRRAFLQIIAAALLAHYGAADLGTACRPLNSTALGSRCIVQADAGIGQTEKFVRIRPQGQPGNQGQNHQHCQQERHRPFQHVIHFLHPFLCT